MRCYLTTDGRLVATQAEAGDGFTRRDIADDKAGLLADINALIEDAHGRGMAAGLAQAARRQRPPRDNSATAHLSRIDHPGVDVDAMIELIARSDGATLKRFAGAVAVRFAELAK
jgi:hypothetical protein